MYIQIIIFNLILKFILSSNCSYTDVINRIRFFDGSELRIVSDSKKTVLKSILFRILKTALVNLFVDNDNVRFLMLGDWGGQSVYPYKTALQKIISQQMSQVASRFKSQFIVTLGNNFFDSGVKNLNDFRFQVYFLY